MGFLVYLYYEIISKMSAELQWLLVHKKTVGVETTEDGKGVVLVTKRSKEQNKLSKSMVKSTLKGGQRAVLTTISRTIRKNRYRKDLQMAAMRRASALMKSQKASAEK